MVILSGTWEFFDDEDFKGTKIAFLGPDRYPKVADKGIKIIAFRRFASRALQPHRHDNVQPPPAVPQWER